MAKEKRIAKRSAKSRAALERVLLEMEKYDYDDKPATKEAISNMIWDAFRAYENVKAGEVF